MSDYGMRIRTNGNHDLILKAFSDFAVGLFIVLSEVVENHPKKRKAILEPLEKLL